MVYYKASKIILLNLNLEINNQNHLDTMNNNIRNLYSYKIMKIE
jgi:hypothetical protein